MIPDDAIRIDWSSPPRRDPDTGEVTITIGYSVDMPKVRRYAWALVCEGARGGGLYVWAFGVLAYLHFLWVLWRTSR